MLTVLLSVVFGILIAYLFILSLRIVLGWFAPQALGRAWDLLSRATDPYLAVFSRIRFLRGKVFDFSPLAAILVIVVAATLVNRLLEGPLTLGFFLAAVFSAAWSGARFMLLLFLIVGVIRMVPFFLRAASGSGIWRVLDMIIQPIVAWVARLFRLAARVTYVQHLLFTIGLLLVVWVMMEFLIVPQVVGLFQMIPF